MVLKKSSKDVKSSIGSFMAESTEAADKRFAIAAQVTSLRPSGLSAPRADHGNVAGYPLPSDVVGSSSDVVMAPIDRVKDNPFNARKIYKESKVKERAASIAKDGQLQPAPACIDPEDPTSFILIGGHYRKRGLLHLGRTHIQLKLLKASSHLDLYRLSFSENNEREDGTPLDNAMAWQDLHDQNVVSSDDEIAATIDVPRSTITKHRQLLLLPPSVLEILKENPERFVFTSAYLLHTLSKHMDVLELEKIAQQIASEGGMSTRELEAIKARFDSPKTRKVKEISRQHKIMVGDVLLGHIKEWDSGRVELDVKVENQAEREKLVAELRERFAAHTQAG